MYAVATIQIHLIPLPPATVLRFGQPVQQSHQNPYLYTCLISIYTCQFYEIKHFVVWYNKYPFHPDCK